MADGYAPLEPERPMRNRRAPIALATFLAVTLPGVALAQQAPDRTETQATAPVPDLSVTQHEVRLDGQVIRYTATAGTMPLVAEDGTHRADVFFVSYTRDGAGEAASRPVTFAFNGGPGSSSVWLHLGALGPRRVLMGPEGEQPDPPYRLVDNPYTWLDVTDLVFIDPVLTGYSRPAEDQDKSQFHGLDEDLESVGEFIRLWTTENERWASPKFLAGESYGTTRAAGLAGYLQDRHRMYFNGVVLISAILDFQTARFDVGNDLPYPLFLPTYAATAWYHGQLPPDLQDRPLREVLDEVEDFATTDYTLALMRGDELDGESRSAIARQLARYTGLSEGYVDATDLRIRIYRFVKELLRDEGRTVGRLDSRFKGTDRDDAGEGYEYDPSMAAISGAYTALLNDYVRRELGYENDVTYEILSGRVRPWSYARFENSYVNVAEPLRSAMTENPALRVFFAGGYYDLATPYFAAEYTVSHMGLDPTLRSHVTFEHYEAGHMMYIREASLAKLKRDVSMFYRSALGEVDGGS